MDKIFTVIFIMVIGVALIGCLGVLLAFPIKWCWNYTMPVIFGLDVITWGQAWCLYFLAGCLIKATQTNN